MKYLKLFSSHSDYDAAKSSLDKPNVSHCVQENEVHYNPIIHDYSQDYLTFVALEDGTFKLSENSVSYSLDEGKTWIELAANTNTPTITTGNKIMWKGTLSPSDDNGIGIFGSSGRFDAQGNIMSLLHGDNFKEQVSLDGKNGAFVSLFRYCGIVNARNLILPATTLASRCYVGMFNGCTSLTTAPELPAATLAYSCYTYMFLFCSSLTSAPELHATTLAGYCYYAMFSNCTSLVTAPELPATTLASQCYSEMFVNCTSLTTAPVLPATTLANDCYTYMFNGCTNLTTAPELPATTLAENCYTSMFMDCTNLTTAPELPATTLAENCYTSMFMDCTNLTTAPELPAITLVEGCYESMFYGCTSLNYIKAMFTTTPNGTHTSEWVSGVAANGTFVKNSAAQWNVTGTNGIPTGWTVQTASE